MKSPLIESGAVGILATMLHEQREAWDVTPERISALQDVVENVPQPHSAVLAKMVNNAAVVKNTRWAVSTERYLAIREAVGFVPTSLRDPIGQIETVIRRGAQQDGVLQRYWVRDVLTLLNGLRRKRVVGGTDVGPEPDGKI